MSHRRCNVCVSLLIACWCDGTPSRFSDPAVLLNRARTSQEPDRQHPLPSAGAKVARSGSGPAPLRPCASLPLTSVPEAPENPASGGPSEDGGPKSADGLPVADGQEEEPAQPLSRNAVSAPVGGWGGSSGAAAAAAAAVSNGNGSSATQANLIPGGNASDVSPYAVFAPAGVVAADPWPAPSAGTTANGDIEAPTSPGGGAGPASAPVTAVPHSNGAPPALELSATANPYGRFAG